MRKITLKQFFCFQIGLCQELDQRYFQKLQKNRQQFLSSAATENQYRDKQISREKQEINQVLRNIKQLNFQLGIDRGQRIIWRMIFNFKIIFNQLFYIIITVFCLIIQIKTICVILNLMNPHKRQAIERQIIQQSGSDTLDLNDIVLGYEGAKIVGALLPQYHKNLRHLRLNGNNIDSEGFQFIFTGLLNCPHLKSIQAQWNSIGNSEAGLSALCALVTTLQYLEYIDLKNNRISFHLANYIAEIVQLNKKNLKVIDLRWNQIGQLGAKQLLSVLPFNKNIKFIGLQDNRISTGTLIQIQNILKNGGARDQTKILKHSSSLPQSISHDFPLSSEDYPSMDIQVRTGQIRMKIDNQQKESNRYTQKVQVQIQKVLQKIKLRGAQIAQVQLKYDSLVAQNGKITGELRQAERLLALQKERTIGVQTKFSAEKSQMRNQKYRLNNNIQNVMQKFTQRNKRQLDEIQLVMGQKLDRLNAFLKQRLHQKRTTREKLADVKEDLMKFKINKEDITNKAITSQHVSGLRSVWDQKIYELEQQMAKVKTTVQNQVKKGQYMSKQLNNQIIKALTKEQSLQKDIFEVQNRIKNIHHDMALKNLDLQRNLAELKLKQSQIFDKQATLQMETKYLKYMQSQGGIKFQVENMIQQQLAKGAILSQDGIDNRISEVERALRAQQAQNRMIKNQYEKLMSQLENVSKKNIQMVLFQ